MGKKEWYLVIVFICYKKCYKKLFMVFMGYYGSFKILILSIFLKNFNGLVNV